LLTTEVDSSTVVTTDTSVFSNAGGTMTIRELLNDWVDYDHSPYGGHINFGYQGNTHIKHCMDHKVYAYIKNRYTCMLFSHTTRNRPMCYVLITHDVDLIPFTWVRLRAFRVAWLDGMKFWDKWKDRTDMRSQESTTDFDDICSEETASLLAEFSYDSKSYSHVDNDCEWRNSEVAVPDGRVCRIFRRPDGGMSFQTNHWWKSHTRGCPVQKTVSTTASWVISTYESKENIVVGKIPKKILEDIKMQMVMEKI
jgi:hypothetical protein